MVIAVIMVAGTDGGAGKMVADERHKVFAELVDRVLHEPELTDAVPDEHAPSAEDLRGAALAHRDSLLGQVRAEEEEYRQATTRAQTQRRRDRWAGVVGWCGGSVVLAAGVVGGWNTELTESLNERRAPSVGTIVGNSVELAFGLIALSALVGALTYGGFWLLSMRVREGAGTAQGERKAGSVIAAILVLVIAVVDAASEADTLVWQLAHGRLAGENDGYAWGDWATYGAMVALVVLGLLFYSLVPGERADHTEADRLRTAWRKGLSDALRGFMRTQISTHIARRYSTTLELREVGGLRQVRGPGYHVPTPAEAALLVAVGGMDGGSIALAGPRGVGKTDLLKAFCADDIDRLGLELIAPVVYDRREFMLRLFARLCEHVISSGLEAKTEAAAHLQWIRHLQTRTDETSVNIGWKGFGLSARRGGGRARQPLTYPEIVDALRSFLQVTANELKPERRLVIGIDELDRIEPAARARDFVNELKVVFDVPHCLFVLSVSDEALREANLTPVGHRDVFDSAIDEIIQVEPLDQATAIRLLDTRAIGLPAPFIALFYCLSGGMPRDLLRTARAAAALVVPDNSRTLPEITAALLDREEARLANAWDTPGDPHPVHRDFLITLRQIFTADLTQDQLHKASDPGFPGSFEALARVRRGIGVAEERAATALSEIRLAWRLEPEGE